MKTKFKFHARRFFSACATALVGRYCVFSVLALLLSTPLPMRAANVAFGFTNAVFNVVDTNSFKVMDCGTINPVQADGTVLTTGRTRTITPGADGRSTNSFSAGFFLVTNAFLRKGFVIECPDDNGPTVYNATDLMISGLNVFISKTVTNTGVTFNAITNALGYTPANSVTADGSAAHIALTNFAGILSTNATNFTLAQVAAVGLAGTNLSTAVSNGVVAYVDSQVNAGSNYTASVSNSLKSQIAASGAAGTNNATSVSNGVVAYVNSQVTAGSNYTASVSNSLTASAAANLLFATNYAATNTTAQISALTLGNTNGLPSVYTTNNLAVTNCGSSGMNGTYVWSGSAYTNITSATYAVTNTGGSWYVISNNVSIYSAATPAGSWSVITGNSPAPSVSFGRYLPLNGVVIQGLIASTNLTDQINTRVNGAGTATSNYVDTKVAAAGLANTNLTLGVGAAVTNDTTARLASQGTAQTNDTIAKLQAQGTAQTNDTIARLATQGAANTNAFVSQAGIATNLASRPSANGLSQRWFDPVGAAAGYVTNDTFVWLGDINNSGSATFGGDLNVTGTAAFGSSLTVNGINSTGISGGFKGILIINEAGDFDSTAFTEGDAAGLTNIPAGQLVGSVADARLSANVPLLTAQNIFTGNSNRMTGNLRVVTNAYVGGTNFAGYFSGDGSMLTGVTASTSAIVTITNGGSTNQFLTNAVAIGGFTNRGNLWLTNYANATQPVALFVKPQSDSSPGKVYALTMNGDTTYFIDGTGQLSHSIDVSMLPLRLKVLETNNGSALTNLNAAALAIGQVPTTRATWALPSTNGYGKSNQLESPFVQDSFGISSRLHFPYASAGVTDLTLRHDGNGALFVEAFNGIGTPLGSIDAQYEITVDGGAGHGFIGNGEFITNISGENIQLGTINSNKFDAATLSLLSPGGAGAGATNAVSTLNGLSNAVTIAFTNIPASTNGIAGIVVSGQNIIVSNRYDSTSGTAITNAIIAQGATEGTAITNWGLATFGQLATANIWTGPSNVFYGNATVGTNLTVSNNVTVVNGTISGNGSGLNALVAENISSGTLSDSHLSPNVALLDAQNNFTGSNNFATNITCALTNRAGYFIGDGSGLTGFVASQIPSLDASKITTGTIGDGRLDNNIARTNNGVVLAVTDGSHVSSNAILTVTGTGGTTATISGNTLTINSTSTSGGVATLTDAATVTIDASGTTNEFVVTLGGNRTIAIPTGGSNGDIRILELGQDATGNRTATLASPSGGLGWDVCTTIDPTGANSLTLSTNANVADRCVIEKRGTNWSVVDFKRGFRKRS